ncbi:MAG: DNA mismatch repair protein MutL, partial [Ruminococcus sp.]
RKAPTSTPFDEISAEVGVPVQNNQSRSEEISYIPFYKRAVEVADSKSVNNFRSNPDFIIKTKDISAVPVNSVTSTVSPQESDVEATPLEPALTQKPEEEIEETSYSITQDEDNAVSLIENREVDFKFIGEAFRTYIIIELDKELMLIDKHAIHERIIYEQLKSNAESFSQLLLVPQSVVLNKSVYTAAVENIDMFSECGFDVEDFGASTLLVRSAPQYITSEDISDTITEMAGYIAMNKRDIRSEKMDWIFHNIACRAAVKAGNKTSEPELKELARKVLTDDSLRYCPHGRPVSVIIKKSEIEKQFGRA